MKSRQVRTDTPARRRRSETRTSAGFAPPLTVSHGALLTSGSDVAFRETSQRLRGASRVRYLQER